MITVEGISFQEACTTTPDALTTAQRQHCPADPVAVSSQPSGLMVGAYIVAGILAVYMAAAVLWLHRRFRKKPPTLKQRIAWIGLVAAPVILIVGSALGWAVYAINQLTFKTACRRGPWTACRYSL